MEPSRWTTSSFIWCRHDVTLGVPVHRTAENLERIAVALRVPRLAVVTL